MKFKAVFLDFYGTLVHEDDGILPLIYDEVKRSCSNDVEVNHIGKHWSTAFFQLSRESYGGSFLRQREIGIQSLADTIRNFNSTCIAEDIIQTQFNNWIQPPLYEDTIPFLESLKGTPIYILSNIDRDDITAALSYHGISVSDVITSEDVRSYKPRSELFIEGLRRSGCTADEVIHMGDSLASDIEGAQRLGMKAAWINRLGRKLPNHYKPDYIYTNLSEINLESLS